MSYLKNLLVATTNQAQGLQVTAFNNRVYDAMVRIKQELGVDDLLGAIDDASEIASEKVKKYLDKYAGKVRDVLKICDNDTKTYFDTLSGNAAVNRSGRNVEKLIGLKWKSLYEVQMEDVNAQMPLAQQIVSKYMSNFSGKAAPKM